MELAAAQGAKIRWDSASLTPYFQYGNGREVWFENRYSLKQKLELVSKYKLAGTALVNLGQEDPAVWESARLCSEADQSDNSSLTSRTEALAER